MAYLDETRLLELWDQVDSVFARLTEAGASISLSNTSLILTSAAGSQLGQAIDLADTFATKQYVDEAVSTGASGKISEGTANGRFGHSIDVSGRNIRLLNYNGTVISTAPLP